MPSDDVSGGVGSRSSTGSNGKACSFEARRGRWGVLTDVACKDVGNVQEN